MAVVLSLLAALSYGLADFVGGVASKRTSPWSVAVVSQLAGAAGMLVVGVLVGGSPTAADFGWACIGGLGNGFGTAFLYRGLSAGRMGVVAPVSGVGAATLPVLAGIALGERPPALAWAGIALALPGIWLVSRTSETSPETSPTSGLLDGILAGLGFGALFVALGRVSDDAGLLPLVVNQLVALPAVALVAYGLGRPWLPRDRAALVGVVPGLLAGTATVFFLLATRSGFLSIAAVITSLYPAVTVLLAMGVLREHIHRSQAVGLVVCLAAVALVASS